MEKYEPGVVEEKWQKIWQENKAFSCKDSDQRPKYYVLDMYPYPSGQGLHVGHLEGYTATDIVARYKRLMGYNVIHPMGWDAFGLPAENYAIKTGIHPSTTTQKNIDNIKRQIQSVGFSYDWDREIDTTDPDYYRWTQWIFLQLFKKGLAYEDTVPINFCPSCKTGLANEEVKGGLCERCGSTVNRKNLRQWILKITEYAERLLAGLEALDWPEGIKNLQKNWIGRSEGADVNFTLKGVEKIVEIFTTRPDTLFGATYMVLAPEHPLVEEITTADRKNKVMAYVEEAAKKSDLLRTELQKDKTGVFTGCYAINPVNGQEIPVWIADYVLMSYGTGAIMAVPSHDQRDYEFATKFQLPIIQVIEPSSEEELPAGCAFAGDGKAVNSGKYTGMETGAMKKAITTDLAARGEGKARVRYKLRDWIFSRQRYWGEPIPLVHCEKCGVVPVPEEQLPLLLPNVDRYEPTGTGESPLAAIEEWINTTCPNCGGPGQRESNTMPQWAGSCWYYLRYLDPKNGDKLVNPEKEKRFLPVDLYIGGAEHAVLHLLYARFWHMFLYDHGVVSWPEPFQKLRNQGMILGYSYRFFSGEDGKIYSFNQVEEIERDKFVLSGSQTPLKAEYISSDQVDWQVEKAFHPDDGKLELEILTDKMSKSRGNVINPDDLVERYGADVVRLYEMFLGPLESSCPWNTKGIEGVNRFLHRAWRLIESNRENLIDGDGLVRLRHQTIKGVSQDLENLHFNVAISKLMVYLGKMVEVKHLSKTDASTFLLLLNPFAPHICEELWQRAGFPERLYTQKWPQYDEQLAKEDTFTLAVQVNGKLRGTVDAVLGIQKEDAFKLAFQQERVQKHLQGKKVIKEIYVPNRLVNLVVK